MAEHRTTFAGQWHPDQFEQDANGLYTASMTVTPPDLQCVTGNPGYNLVSADNGIKDISIHTFGGGADAGVHASQMGFTDVNGKFTPFDIEGHTAATIMSNGMIVKGHHSGDNDGFIKPKDLNVVTSQSTHLPGEAAQAMQNYNGITREKLAEQTFDSYPTINVAGNGEFCMLPDGSYVKGIIKKHGSNPDFMGGAYKGKNHVVPDSGDYLVPKEHYNQIMDPLSDALTKTQQGLTIRVVAGKKPTEPVNYNFGFTHPEPQQTVKSSSGEIVTLPQDNSAIVAALSKMGISNPEITIASESD